MQYTHTLHDKTNNISYNFYVSNEKLYYQKVGSGGGFPQFNRSGRVAGCYTVEDYWKKFYVDCGEDHLYTLEPITKKKIKRNV